MEPAFDGPYQGTIGHAGFGGSPVLNAIPGADAEPAGGLAIDESDLYWFNFEEGFGTSLPRAELHGLGSTVDRHLIDHVGVGSLAVNSASSPPPPPPPPPPTPPIGSTGTPITSPGSTLPPSSTSTPPKSLPTPKVKLNKAAGLASLTLAVPGPGVVVLSGSGIKSLHKTAKRPGPVILIVRPTSTTTKRLKSAGKAKVAPKLTFSPATGAPIARVLKLTLRLG